ncbi:FMN-binding protein [Desulfococcaceae bacterium HSG9]|nr:FMN-binding protein [Desulfococcaceae bacterium HSG9]
MSDNLKSILFAVGMAVVCSTLLTAAALGLKPYKMRNILADRQKNILKSVGLIDEDKRYSYEEIETMFAANIKSMLAGGDGRIMPESETHGTGFPIWLYIADGLPERYVVPVNTRGLWGPIKGYLALEKDGSTISGFTVYKHSETPGLGGEIEQAWFQKNFRGKKITDAQGDFVSISVAKGRVHENISLTQQPNFVDGISGATLTGKFLTTGFKAILQDYEPVSVRFRTQGARIEK